MKYITLIITLLLISISAAETFRFAWFSDTHIGATGANDDLRQAVTDANTQDIDFVIISGDITELDVGANLDSAQAILDQLRFPYHIIPGNHDTKWSASGGRKFERLWGDDKFQFEYNGIRFIGLHQGPLLRMGDGYIVPEDLAWLDSLLTGLPDPHQKLIFITHYGLDESVSNWFEFLDLIKPYNTQAILHGHGHANLVRSYEGVPGIMGRSTLTRGEQAGGYNLVTLRNDSLIFNERLSAGETLISWHGQPLVNFRQIDSSDCPRPDFMVNQAFPGVQSTWEFDSGFAIASAPALAGDRVIITDAGGRITALAVDSGKLIWQTTVAGPVYSTPDVTDDLVLVSSTDSMLYCLGLENGQIIWRYPTGAPLVASPVSDGKSAFCGGSDGVFRAIDLKTGKLLWEFTGVIGFVETVPLLHRGKVIFGAWDENLYALSACNGKLKWKWQAGRPGILYSPAACQPVAAGNKVFIVAPDRVMTCIRARNGKTIWREDRFPVRESIGISTDGKTVFAKTMWDTVVACATGPRNFDLQWAADADYGYDIDPAVPVEKDGTLFLGTKNGWVYALDSTTGDVRWRYRIGVGLVNDPLPLSGTVVLVTAMDGRIVRLDAQ